MSCAENWNCRAFSIVCGVPKLEVGFDGINSAAPDDVGATEAIGVKARLPPGMTTGPTGQAVEAAPAWIALLTVSL